MKSISATLLFLIATLACANTAHAFDIGKLKEAIQSSVKQAGEVPPQVAPPHVVDVQQAPVAGNTPAPTIASTSPLDLKGVTLGMPTDDVIKLFGKSISKTEISDQCLVANHISLLHCSSPGCGTFAGANVESILILLEGNTVFETMFLLKANEAEPNAINQALLAKYGKPERYSRAYYAELATKPSVEKGIFKRMYDTNYYSDHYLGELKYGGSVFNAWRNQEEQVIVLGTNGTSSILAVKLTSEANLKKKEGWKEACASNAEQLKQQKHEQETSKRAKDL